LLIEGKHVVTKDIPSLYCIKDGLGKLEEAMTDGFEILVH